MKLISIFQPKIIARDKKGRFIDTKFPKNFNKEYSSSIIKYLNCLDPLFKKAKRVDEFQFILTLLRFRGIRLTAHDPYENSVRMIDSIMNIEKKLKGHEKTNIFLWVYGHIIEASEPYETIANLINIVDGGSYRAWNFPKIKRGKNYYNQYPFEKIKYLKEKALKIGMADALVPINEIIDRDLRNAIFHSDYAVSFGEVITSDPPRIYSDKEILKLINRALAYHEVVKNLITNYTEWYILPKKIKASSSFSKSKNEKAQIIIRKNKGVIGMKDSWNKKQITNGEITWFIGNLMPYEKKYIDRGIYVLPPNRIDLANKIISILPNIFKGKMISLAERLINKYA